MLKRSIDFHSDPTIEERLFLGAKRVCIGFAVLAVTISALDLMNIRPVEAAAEMIQERQLTASAIPSALMQSVRSFSLSSAEKTEIAVLIPRDISMKSADRVASSAAAPRPTLISRRDASPVAALAEARHEDAIEVAMAATSPGLTPAPQPERSEPNMELPKLQLASLDPALPVERIAPVCACRRAPRRSDVLAAAGARRAAAVADRAPASRRQVALSR